jgi:hypothetical protein
MDVSTTDPPPEGHHHLERGAPPPHSTSLPSMASMPPSSSLPLSRLGRYDPVRATFVTRSTPTPTATAPQARSPAQQRGEDNEEEVNKDRKTPISPKEDR